MNNRQEINLFELSEVTGKLLSRLLHKKQKNGRLLKKGKPYWLGLQRIYLSHDIMIREKVPGTWHYDVIDDNDCGAGKFGSAHNILAVLKRSNHDGYEVNLKKKRIYKIQNNAAIEEFTLMQRCPHLHARTIFSAVPSYISMRKFTGAMLNDVLNNERKFAPFTHSQRYRVTISLLRALKKQMHDNMICHRDIKPDNIFYNPENGEIDIFDLGISQLIGDTTDKRSRGNATFSAPEEFTSVKTSMPVTMSEFRVSAAMKSMSSVAADIYSMARVIGLVWRDSDPIFFAKDIDHVRLMKRRIHENWQPNFKLFQNLPSVTQEERLSIEQQLRRMTALDPNNRPSLPVCIAYFDHLFLEYKLSKTPDVLHEVIMQAHALALRVQSKLDEIEERQDLAVRVGNMIEELKCRPDEKVKNLTARLNAKICYEYHVLATEIENKYLYFSCDPDLSVSEFLGYLKNTSSFQVLFSYISSALEDLSDHPRAVIEFIETLDIKVFYGILSKDDLIKKIDEINSKFLWHLHSLLSLYDDMRSSGDTLRATDLNYFLTSMADERMTIDGMHEAAEHMQRKLIKLTDMQKDPVPRVDRRN